MTTKKKTTRKKASTKARSTADVLKEKWEAAVAALTAAEAQVEQQVRQFVAKNKVGQDATRTFNDLRQKVERERKKAARELEGRLKGFQGRLKVERKNLGRRVDDAVHRALVAFNIPSRQEVAELTRKVDELSRKIDGFRGGRRATVAKAAKRA
jgi:hypothetical protein